MNDLQTRIAKHVDDSVPPVDIDLLVEQLAETTAPTRWLKSSQASARSRWRRRWAPILAGAAVVLLLIGGVALVRSPTESPLITTPDEMIPSPTTVPAPTVLSTPATGRWATYELLGNSVIGDDLVVSSVTPVGPGFVAAGLTWRQGSGDVWSRGQIWTSIDGLSWTWVADDDHTLFEEGNWPEGVLSTDSGLIVWGSNGRQGGNVIWHSSDGVAWSLVTTAQIPTRTGGFTDGLALASGGYLLYGSPANCSVETGTCTPVSAPRLLVSSDGVDWELIETPVTFTAIAETAGGELLGAQRRASEPTTWISADGGRTWQRHGPDHSIDIGQPSAQVWTMVDTPYGLIASGLNAEKQPVLWISDDSNAFTPTLQLPVGGAAAAIAFGQGWVVAAGSGDNLPALWASEDGHDWVAVPLVGAFRGEGGLSDIAYGGSAFIAVGQHRAEIGGEALILTWAANPD